MSAPIETNDFASEQAYKDGQPNGSGGPGANTRTSMPVRPRQAQVSQVYDPEFFKIANPGPLGLISFALTTFVLGLYQCGAG
jgi:hypothetical protein